MSLSVNTTRFFNSPSSKQSANGPETADHFHHGILKRFVGHPSKMNLLAKVLILLSMVMAVSMICWHWDGVRLTKEALRQGWLGEVFSLWVMVFLIINALAFLWRLMLVVLYRSTPAVSDDRLPVCTVVVPAYNEGKQVLKTLESLASGDYPENKMNIIVVDDGSVDDTWFWINKARKAIGPRLKTIRLPQNGGKRHALYEGFKESRGEVLVTVDSDSVVDPWTLRHMVSPFVQNPEVGAVAGNVRVLNTRDGLIPKMLDVSFLFSFDFLRASQSMVNTVMCTPGALSAYRRDIVFRVLPHWLNQKFFGKPANIGEDRAMTNLILRQGYCVHYQQKATVYTNVPVKYKNLCKMLLRWARSNIRETLVMGAFIFTRFRKKSMVGARINFTLQFLNTVKSPFFTIITFGCLFWRPFEFGLATLMGILVYSTLSALFYFCRCRSTDALWAYSYGLFWLAGLCWIPLYALGTPYKTGWLTRQPRKIRKTYQRKREPEQRVLTIRG